MMHFITARRLGLLVPLFAAAPVMAQQSVSLGWRLVYSVDSSGKRVAGDKEALLAAVRSGQPVRVGWTVSWRLPDGTPGGIEHVADAAFLSIHQGEVFAQIPPILGQTPAPREPAIAFRTEGDRLWYALLDTTGRLHGYFTGGGPPQTQRVSTHWFAAGLGSGAPGRLD